LVSGYYIGRDNTNSVETNTTAPQAILTIEQPGESLASVESAPLPADRYSANYHRSEAPLNTTTSNVEHTSDLTAMPAVVIPAAENTTETSATLSVVTPRHEGNGNYAIVNKGDRNYSLAELMEVAQQPEEGDILHRIELGFGESFGKEFPADANSRNTQPIIT